MFNLCFNVYLVMQLLNKFTLIIDVVNNFCMFKQLHSYLYSVNITSDWRWSGYFIF